jgi:very-short-patch-repair endonuclease
MTNAWRASEVAELGRPDPGSLSPCGRGKGPAAEGSGKGEGAARRWVRGNEAGLTKRQRLPATTVFRSRDLRRNAGPVELALKAALRRALPEARFRHQAPFGPYHADFCSHGAKLIVEVDDATHAERRDRDEARTRFLNAEGYRVLRFWNNDVMTSIEGVVAEIARNLPPELQGSFA